MSESTPTSSTGTAKSPGERTSTAANRYALELHVLVMKLRDVCVQFLQLPATSNAQYITSDDLHELRRMFRAVERLDVSAADLEERWRARQGLSPKS
jgi:hypothetical protein